MTGLRHDLRHAGRMARRHPGFAGVVVAAMALGIGLNCAVFSLLDALLLRPPPVADSERLAHVYSLAPGAFLSHAPMAFPDYETVREREGSFEEVAAYAWFPLALERGDGSELVLAELVTGGYFDLLGARPAFGRALEEGDDRAGAPAAVAMLTHDGWRRHFAGDPGVVGREVRLNGRGFTVVGVGPPGLRSLVPGLAPDLWLPMRAGAALPAGVTIGLGAATPGRDRLADRGLLWVWAVGRLRPGTAMERAGAEVALVAGQLAAEFPATNGSRGFAAVAADGVRLLPGLDRTLWSGSLLVMGVFALALLLAAVNVATLFLAVALGRRREIATRLALGAGRGRLVRQLFLEGLCLALAGGAAGLLLAHGSNAWLGRVTLPSAAAVSWPLDLVLAPALDWRVAAFALASAVSTAVVFALLPALEATRADLAAMLREAGAVTGGSRRPLRGTLVAAQVAISVVLLAAAGAAVGGLVRAARVDLGFDPERAVAVTLSPDLLGYQGERVEDYFTEVRERVAALPGVRSAALASHLPLTFALNIGHLAPAGGDAGPPETWPLVDSASVGAGYFETLGIPLLAGRTFRDSDGAGAPGVVVVNETLARRFWPGATAVGRRLHGGEEVVGVVRDGKYRTPGESPRPFLYLSLLQSPRGTRTLVARTAGDPRPLLPAVGAAARSVDPRVPAGRPRTLADTVGDALLLPRLTAGVFGFFGALGLLLAAVGVSGVVAYLAAARTREIGLRLALGAQRRAILGWLLSRGLSPVAAGLAVGLAAAVAAGRALAGLSTAFGPLDFGALLAAAALLALVALAAALVPARRAAGLDPGAALRHE